MERKVCTCVFLDVEMVNSDLDQAFSYRPIPCFQLQERLQQRREARKRAALDSRQEERRAELSPMPGSDGMRRSDSVSTVSSMVSAMERCA